MSEDENTTDSKQTDLKPLQEDLSDDEYTEEEYNKSVKTKSKRQRTSSFSAPPSIATKSPYEWTPNEVAGWIAQELDYVAQAQKFANAMIDGSKLFQLNRTMLQNNVKIFDVKARNGILKEIKNLKLKIKESQKNKIESFAATHTRKQKKEKSKVITDNPKLRKYIKINKLSNSADSELSIDSILQCYDINDADINEEKCVLKYHSKFMFQIYANQSHFIYLFTKSVDDWSSENVYQWTTHISNDKFALFAHELKRKKINGKKLLKYTRKSLQSDYSNYFDASLRKQMLDEINLLKRQLFGLPLETKHTRTVSHKRSKSEIERDRERRQKMRKQGPRDVGKIKYDGSKYDSSKDKAFLEDTIHPLSKDEKFQKRKILNPAEHKPTMDEIGKNKGFSGTKYDDSNDAGFLADRMHTLSKDEKFQKRKELNPTERNPTVSEIGKVKGFKGLKYDDSNDAGFLADRVHTLSKDERFQQRKEVNPVQHKETVIEIGKNRYSGTKYDGSNDAGFLDDRVHTLSKDERFQQRKEVNPVQHKETVTEIGKIKGFSGTKYDDSKDGGFLDDRVHVLSKDARFQQRKEVNPVQHKETVIEIGKNRYSGTKYDDSKDKAFLEEYIPKENKDYEELAKLSHKQGAVETGKIKGFDAINYELSEEESMGNPLVERRWYDSSAVNQAFDEGISHILKSVPAHKLRVMDNVPLPTGHATKMVWLKRLRDVIEGELRSNSLKKQQTQLNIRQQQLNHLDAMLGVLETGKGKKKKKSKKKKTGHGQ